MPNNFVDEITRNSEEELEALVLAARKQGYLSDTKGKSNGT